MVRPSDLTTQKDRLVTELSNLQSELNRLKQEVINTNNEATTATRNGDQNEARRLSDKVNDLYRQINSTGDKIRDTQRELDIVNRQL